MRIALGLEYDGSGFCGWQKQPSGCSVQDAVDAALSQIAAQPVRSQCAGRTDAGVHALNQVVHFDTSARRPVTAWVRGVNTILPRAISIQWAREVSDEFHSRSKATGRAYAYLLLNRPERPGVHASRVGWHHRPHISPKNTNSLGTQPGTLRLRHRSLAIPTWLSSFSRNTWQSALAFAPYSEHR